METKESKKKNFSTTHGNIKTKRVITAIDNTEADKIPSGITDITNIPDLALWSKEMTTGNVTNVEVPITQGSTGSIDRQVIIR